MYHTLSRAAALALVALVTTGLVYRAAAQDKDKDKAPFERVPQLVLARTGPHAPVNALAFSPDASVLYVAGFDKLVRRYKLDDKGKYAAAAPIRIPIGPGNGGVVNALAVSPDGKWVAAAGRAPMRGEGWASADDGIDLDARRLKPEVQADAGVIYLFDPADPDGGKVLRGPLAAVRALAFANPSPATGPVLVAASAEWDETRGAKGDFVGTVRVFDVAAGEQIADRRDLTASAVPPGIAAWATGAKGDGLRVVVAWDAVGPGGLLPSKLLTWDDPKPNGGGTTTPDAAPRTLISPLAARVKGGAVTELVHGGYDKEQRVGLHVRPIGGAARSERLEPAAKGEVSMPYALAAPTVPGHGDAVALLMRAGSDATGTGYELRLRTAKGERPTALTGFSRPAVLTASPDGRFLAVAGFADNRVEVHDAVALAAGNPKKQELAGDARGFRNVAFLAGEKVWVGGEDEAPGKGGAILDLTVEARVAAPPGKDAPKVDAPPAAAKPEFVAPDAVDKRWRVKVAVGGADRFVSLPDGTRPTAAALLPAKPAWDADLGPVLAVAQFDDRAQAARVTLYDPTDGKVLYQLGGPTLVVKALAFSGTRALLAAAGDDGTVPVWSLKNITRRYPAIDGLGIADVKGAVTVTKVRDKTDAAEVFKVDDVIVSVADAKGVQIPVKAPLDFAATVRGLKIGDKVEVKLKDRAVKVNVGARIGFRQPLFTLWVDPVLNAGRHEWVGWAATGRYDAGGAGGEGRIGWVTATGNPARPVAFTEAKEYRKLFYSRDFIRLLLKHADYDAAEKEIPRLPAPTLVPVIAGERLRDGRFVVREKLAEATIKLERLDTTLDLDRARLEWQVVGPTATSAPDSVSFSGGRVKLDLGKHEWVRGEHRIRARLLEESPDGDGTAKVGEITAVVVYVPPKPLLALTVDGKAVADGATVETTGDEVTVGATARAPGDPEGALAAVSWAAEKPHALPRAADGSFAPKKVPVELGDTLVRVTAINRGAGATADEEAAVEVRVRRLAPKAVPPPAVKLSVETPHDHRASADAPYVFDTPNVKLTAEVAANAPVTALEWRKGTGAWEALKADARSVSLAVALGDEKPVEVQVRAKSANSGFAAAAVVLRYEGLPEVGLDVPPAEVAAPDLSVGGELKAPGPRAFAVRVRVTSARTGQAREFDAAFDPGRTRWRSGVTLFPGENRFAYAVYFDGRRVHQSETLTAVRYVRRPVAVGGGEVDVGAGTSGDVSLAVAAPPDAAFRELLVNGAAVRFRAAAKPVRVFGAALWAVEARGATVNPDDRNAAVPATVRTDDGASAPVALAVRAAPPPPVKIAPPAVRLARNGKSFAPDQGLPPVSDPRFAFDVTVNSEAPLTRFEVSFGPSPTAALAPVGKATAADARAVPGGFELTAAPAVPLRRGPTNYVRVVAANAGGATEVGFGVSYTPPAPRVVIASVREVIRDPKGERLGERKDPPRDGKALPVGTEAVEVEGKVAWDDAKEPIATARDLSVVFVANGVAHVPVPVDEAPAGARERRFKGKVFLNTLDPGIGLTRVRVELRRGDRAQEQETAEGGPREGPEPATLVVQSTKPLRAQRLHVVVVGVQVRREEEADLLRRVIKAVGGENDGGDPPAPGRSFKRRDFAEAILYKPELRYARQDGLNLLLEEVRRDIERHTAEKGWMNDVVVVYYHGQDWVGQDGKWFLHSATTADGSSLDAARDAIRLDNLARTHGMPVAVLNVSGTAAPAGDLAIDLPFMRAAWAQPSQRGRLLDQFAAALAEQRRTFGGVVTFVGSAPGGPRTFAALPDEGAGGRVVGLSTPKP